MDSSVEVILLDSWVSVFSARVRIALEEKGICYQKAEQDLTNKSTILVESNPVHKKIPVLIHNGKPICESTIIVKYIDETWKGSTQPPFLPSDPYLKAQARFWADYVDKKLYGAAMKVMMTKGEGQEKAVKEFIDILKVLEGQLGDNTYFNGETFGYVDIALVPFYFFFYTYETLGNFSVEKECPKLIAWAKRCMGREGVSKSAPDPHKLYQMALKYLEGLSG